MNREEMSLQNSPLIKPAISAATLGVCCCALAAVCYTLSNACLRQLSTMVDPVWVTCIKESTAFAYAALWILLRLSRRQAVFPPWKEVGILVGVGLAVQFIGNLGYVWALGKIGLAVTTPTSYGTQLLAVALFGWLILGERVTFRSAIALGLLMIALVLLSCGAEAAGKSIGTVAESSSFSTSIAFAVAASCLAGVVYASLSIALRRCSSVAVEQSALLFIVAGMGAVTMWPLSFYRVGAEGLLNTSSGAIPWLLSASLFNLIGFLGIAKGLQLTSVVHASVLNASQVAMSAVVGMVYFQEHGNSCLIAGVAITILGIMLIDRPMADKAVEVTV